MVKDEPAFLPRAQGRAELEVKWQDGRTRLAHALEEGAAKLRFPRADDPAGFEAVWINSAGGLTDGDRLTLRVKAGEKARLLLTSQAAEKVYRARHGMAAARLDVRLDAALGSHVEWLPQETILFESGMLERSFEVDLAPGATLLAAESVVLGRTARGEVVERGQFADSWMIRREGQPIWADRLRLTGAIGALGRRPALLDGARAFASILYVGADAESRQEAVREWCEALPIRAGCSARGELLALRCLAADGDQLRMAMSLLLSRFRSALAGATVPLPRLWSC
ncbi:urease accessory protein UreD [Arboricoccus pini]|uniref:urease accessory protein UreD n=1 Tax=Arboricoccus pini TaxID=1963835 RepID=UPI000B50E968|nr:urease accessory protein UreD [Arboricoccus pini]